MNLRITRQSRARIFYAVLLIILTLGVFESVSQYRESQYVNRMAHEIVARARSQDTTASITALRDYLRANVTRENYSLEGRPYLRYTAADTLRSGKGHCGDATRAFVNLAGAMGIRAQRLYLEGKTKRERHVVALVTLNSGQKVIVDAADQPYFSEFGTLDQVLQHPRFGKYSTFNDWRLGIWLNSNAINLGPLIYFLENPHALKALVWLAIAFGFVNLSWLLRPVRRWRGRRARVALAPNDWQTAPASSANA